MKKGVIMAAARHTTRRMRGAMQGNAIRALVELVTNADDSYICMEHRDEECTGTIYISYLKQGRECRFSVRDNAEGMSYDSVVEGFTQYGAATSGRTYGSAVRGYFGQGAKDALATMVDGSLVTFRDDWVTVCRLYINEKGEPCYGIDDSIPASARLRTEHRIHGNGTVAYFTADPDRTGTVPRFSTVHEQVTNNHLLRKILTSPRRKVHLLNLDEKRKERRPLRYVMPAGDLILSDKYSFDYGKFGGFPIHMTVLRASRGELTQNGDDRHGGLLIVDEADAVLGISLFRFDNEPLAARLFGELRIDGFRKLLDEEEPVLSEERDGLEARHPFCQKLIADAEKRLAKVVQQEKSRKRDEALARFDAEEASRYRRAFGILNEIAEEEVKDAINLVKQDDKDTLKPPPDGFCLYPSQAHISMGKKYNFEIRWDTHEVRPGSLVRVSSSHPKVTILSHPFRTDTERGSGIGRRFVSIEGKAADIKATIKATCKKRESEAQVYVGPEQDYTELLYEEGMVFQPETLTLRPNQPRRLSLLVYVKMIEGGSSIELSSDNPAVRLSANTVVVNEAEAQKHVAKYDLEVWGEGAGQDALLTAEWGQSMAVCQVLVRAKPEKPEDSRKGMFAEPEYDLTTQEPLQRTSYSSESGKVIIYVNFPSVRHYVGAQCEYRTTLPAQIMIADLVAETCFREIAKRRVEASGAVLRPEAIADRIQRESYLLSRKYGKRVHAALVDPKLLEAARLRDEQGLRENECPRNVIRTSTTSRMVRESSTWESPRT